MELQEELGFGGFGQLSSLPTLRMFIQVFPDGKGDYVDAQTALEEGIIHRKHEIGILKHEIHGDRDLAWWMFYTGIPSDLPLQSPFDTEKKKEHAEAGEEALSGQDPPAEGWGRHSDESWDGDGGATVPASEMKVTMIDSGDEVTIREHA